MNSEISILPAKTGLDGLVPNSSKVNKTDTTSFGTILKDAKVQSDNGVEQTEINGDILSGDVLKKLDAAIQFLTEALNVKTISTQMKAELQKFVGLLKTVKVDVKAGKTLDSSIVKKLFASLSEVKELFHNKDENLNSGHLEQLINDFKKKFGKDPFEFIQMLMQTVVPPVISPIVLSMKQAVEAEKVESQSSQSTTTLEPINKLKSGNLAKVVTPQKDSQKPTSDTKAVIEKPDLKSKMADVGASSDGKKQSMPKDGESPSSQPNQVRSLQWVPGGQVHKIQQLVLHSIPKVQSPSVQISNQVREVISKGIIKPIPDGGLELTIKLHPVNLGTVQVVLSQTAAGLQATILAQSQTTKDLLQSQLSQLKQSFATLGINVQKLDVSQFNQPQAQQNPSQFNGQAFQQSGGDAHGGQRRDSDDSHKVDTDYFDLEPETTFDEWLKEGGII